VAWSGPGIDRRPLSAGKGQPKANVAKTIRLEGARILGKERFELHQQLERELNTLRYAKVPAEMALCVSEANRTPPETFVLLRGNAHVKGDKVEPAFPLVLGTTPAVIPPAAPGAKTSGRRLVLANWITAPDNQLTSRVMANRIWQFHFGRGIVRSSSNYGTHGDKPTHPELLDYLASEFVAGGWRMKAMHRQIMASNTYRMSSKNNPAAHAVDPANDLLWRFDMRRLNAEEIRDSILMVTGSLNPKMYGPSTYPEIPREVLAGQSVPGNGWAKVPLAEQNRRSVYVHIKRSLLLPILESFDQPDPDRSSPVRFSTTQPTQALSLLNSDFINKQAVVFAARLRSEAGEDAAKQVRLALTLTTGRSPSDGEIKRGVGLIDTLRDKEGVSSETALRYFCLVALNLNEFVYLD
jgi:Protein of unknown function (DUF1553)